MTLEDHCMQNIPELSEESINQKAVISNKDRDCSLENIWNNENS